MISVQNLQQPSNGSKWLFILMILTSFSACNLFKPVSGNEKYDPSQGEDPELEEITGKRVYDPETGTYVVVEEVPREGMDTIKWKEASTADFPAIKSNSAESASAGGLVQRLEIGQYGTEKLSAYNVSFMLPFVTDRFNPNMGEINSISDWALHFYGGAKIAFDKLNEEGVKLNVSTFDTQGSPRSTSQLLRTEESLKNAHMIIGPYRKENVSLLETFIRRNDVLLVSPHFVPPNDSQNNPKYLQVKPSIKAHCEALVRHARKYYRTDQIVIVARNNPEEIQAMQYLQQENLRLSGGRDTASFQEYIISVNDQSQDFENIDVLPFVTLGDSTAFIIPSWSSQKFVYSFLRKVSVTKAPENQVVVYGMPSWAKFDRVDFEYYDNLDVHISSSTYLNPMSSDVQLFKKEFFDRYGVVPNEEAFLGHDVTLYFGRMLNTHGTKLQYFIPTDPQDLLHTRFEFDATVFPTTTGAENLPIQKFENKFVHILKFQDFQFQPVY